MKSGQLKLWVETNEKFGLEEKLQILREGENQGVDVTCRKYQIARSLYYNWKSKFDRQGPDGLAGQYHRVDPRIKALEKEVIRHFEFENLYHARDVFERYFNWHNHKKDVMRWA
ncbi:MAG: helix-turn-helix domain-containing protein, partial [Ignavibacteria bacterium]